MSLNKFRQTGRTTRMLEFAIEQAKEGKQVIVYSLGGEHMDRLMGRLHELSKPDSAERRRRYMYGRGSISLWAITDSFDWHTMEDREVHEDAIHLVDHWAIEVRYPAATIAMLYQFIEGPKESNEDVRVPLKGPPNTVNPHFGPDPIL
jgi:hypothetical protein